MVVYTENQLTGMAKELHTVTVVSRVNSRDASYSTSKDLAVISLSQQCGVYTHTNVYM